MGEANIAFLAQDYAFGRDGIKAFKEILPAVKQVAKVGAASKVAGRSRIAMPINITKVTDKPRLLL